MDDEPDYKAERDVYSRVGISRESDVSRTMISAKDAYGKKSINFPELNRRIARLGLSDNEKYKMLLGIVYDRAKLFIGVTQSDLERTSRLGNLVDRIGTKNPLASLLGEYVLKKNNEIDKEKLKEVSDYLSKDKITMCTIEDVIRYARLWISLL